MYVLVRVYPLFPFTSVCGSVYVSMMWARFMGLCTYALWAGVNRCVRLCSHVKMVLWSKTHYVPTALVVLALSLALSQAWRQCFNRLLTTSVGRREPTSGLTRTSEPPFSLTGLLFCLTPQQSANCVSVMFLVHWTWCDVIRALGGVGYLKTAYNWFQSSS